jgi:hypothetical protein
LLAAAGAAATTTVGVSPGRRGAGGGGPPQAVLATTEAIERGIHARMADVYIHARRFLTAFGGSGRTSTCNSS